MDDWAKLVAVSCDSGLYLLQLALAHGVLSRIRIIVLPIAWHVHPVDVLHDHLLLLSVLLGARVLSFLDVLDWWRLLALDVECRLADWLPPTIQLQIGCLRAGLRHLRLLLSAHSHRVLMWAHLILIYTGLHIDLLAWNLVSGIVWCKWSVLLLDGSELLLCSQISLTSLIWIVVAHALLVNGLRDGLWGRNPVSVCISTLAFLGSVLGQSLLLLSRKLIWILLLAHRGLNDLLRSLWRVLLLRNTNWGVDFICRTASVCALVFRHNIVERLVLEISIAFLLLWLVNLAHRWSTSGVGGLQPLTLHVAWAW